MNLLSSQPVILPPTQTDQIIIDAGSSGKADPNDRIRYTVTVTNTGASSAIMTQLNAVLDGRTTLVAGSFRTSPLASPDAYASTGNIGITVSAANGVKANDFDDNIPGLILTAGTFATTGGGQIILASDGSFTYNPAAGFTGTDTYVYTLTDGNPVGLPVPLTDMGTITFTVSNMIWFIDNAAGGTGGTGTLNNPFRTIGDFNASSGPLINQIVFLKNTGVNYTQGIVLKNGQLFYGTGHTGGSNLADIVGFSLPANSNALPPINGIRPIITNTSGNGINLASGNTVRGIEVGATSGAKVLGNNFGTLTIGNTTSPDVLLGGTGQALNMTTGTFAATSKFVSVTSTSSATQGIVFAGIGGTVAFGSTTISGSTTTGILIGTSTAVMDFGNTSITPGTDGISFQNNSAGTKTIGTLNITNGTGAAFLHGAAGGPVTVTGQTTITNPGGRGIDIQNSTTAVTFANVNVTQTGGTGVHLQLNSGNITFADLDITPDANQRALYVLDDSGTTTTTSGTISNSGAIGVEVNRAAGVTPLAMVLTSITTSGGTNGVFLQNASGSFDGGTGTLAGSTAAGFLIQNGTATVTYSGSISTSGSYAVDIDNHDSNNITFQTGSITNANNGIRIQNCGGGTILFSGPTKTLTTTTNSAVTLSSNSGATINFTGGGLAITTTSGTGFNATGGATAVNVTGTGNTISSGTGTALNVNGTTIGSSNLNFQSITSIGGTATGIILDNTGSSGGLIVSGDGTNTSKGGNATGGTIANKTGADGSVTTGCGIYLNNTSSVQLRRMQLNDFQNLGVYGQSVNGFTLQYSTINGVNGTSTGSNDACLAFGKSNPSGTNGLNGANASLINNCIIRGAIEHNVEFYNQSGSFTLTISNSNITNNSVAGGSDGILVEMQGSASANITVSSCFFDENKSQAIQMAANDNSSITSNVNNCKALRTSQGNEGFVFSNGANGSLNATFTSDTVSGFGGVSIFVGQTPGNASSTSSLTANISSCIITAPASATNHAIIAFLTSTVGQVANANITIDNNTITQNSTNGVARGILIDEPDANTSPSYCGIVTNNTVHIMDNVAGVVGIVCQKRRANTGTFDVRSNTVDFPNGNPGVAGIRVRQVAPGTCQLEQGISAGAATTVLAANNPASTTEILGTVTVVANNTCN